jgi:dihydrofolate reductase
MRKLVVFMMVTLDGVIQAPGGPEEDTSLGFKYGGWVMPYYDDAFADVIAEELREPFDMLLGKKTYDIFAGYWPHQTGPIAEPFGKATKYVVSDSPVKLTWKESVHIDGDVVAKIKALKEEAGPMIQVHGSGRLVQTLLKNDLVDELRLRIVPITIGTGQRLFEEGTIPATFKLLESKALPTGVIIANYERSGELKASS